MLVVVSGLFGGGWLLGRYGDGLWNGLVKHSIDAYVNKYNAASGANTDSLIYYVVSSEPAELTALADRYEDIIDVQKTPYRTLFDVQLKRQNRHERLREIRSLQGVSAVFTIPFMCH